MVAFAFLLQHGQRFSHVAIAQVCYFRSCHFGLMMVGHQVVLNIIIAQGQNFYQLRTG